VKIWHAGKREDFGCAWEVGDVVGFAVDVDAGTVSFSLNGSWERPWGVAFSGIQFDGPVVPALTVDHNSKLEVNFGHQPFRFSPPWKEGLAAEVTGLSVEEKAQKYDEIVGALVPTAAVVSDIQSSCCHLKWEAPVGISALNEYEVKVNEKQLYAVSSDLSKLIDGLPSGSRYVNPHCDNDAMQWLPWGHIDAPVRTRFVLSSECCGS
jgi:hypothetical protein